MLHNLFQFFYLEWNMMHLEKNVYFVSIQFNCREFSRCCFCLQECILTMLSLTTIFVLGEVQILSMDISTPASGSEV